MTGPQRAQHLGQEDVRRCVADDAEHEQLDPLGAGRPAGCDGAAVGRATRSTGRRPAPPAVDRHDREEDLATGLAPQRLVDLAGQLTGGEDGEEQDVADQADRPGPHEPLHAEDRAGEAEDVADDLAGTQRSVARHRDRAVDEPFEQVHHSSSSFSGVWVLAEVGV